MVNLWTLAPTKAAYKKKFPYREWELHDGKKVVKVYKSDLATTQVKARLEFPTILMRVNYIPRKRK